MTGAIIDYEEDLQRPCESVASTVPMLGSTDKRFIRAGIDDGFSVDFGHDDLLTGIASPKEIFPIVSQWLDERSSG